MLHCDIHGCKVGVKDENNENPTLITIAENVSRDVFPIIDKINDLVGPEYAIWCIYNPNEVDE